MPSNFPNQDELKSRAATLKRLLQEKHSIELKHGHCLELVAKMHGLKDWNTMSALAPRETDIVGESTLDHPHHGRGAD